MVLKYQSKGDKKVNTEILDTNKGGRAYPDAQDGLPENANEKAVIEMVDDDFLNDDKEVGGREVDNEDYRAIPAAEPGKKLNAAITSGVDKIIKLKAERTLINAQIKEVVEGLEGQGILRDALKDTIKKMEWTEAKRHSYNLGCNLSGNALGIHEQTELFSVN